MNNTELTTLLVPLAAVIAPVLAALVSRVLVVPLVVFEIALGMLIGPAGLGWVSDSATLDALSQFGLAALFFMAGNEINPSTLRGRTAGRALGWWGVSALLALTAGFFVAWRVGENAEAAIIIAVALTGTALGTIMPMLRDAGLTHTRLGSVISVAGAIGEFAPLVAISVFLSGKQPLAGSIVLVVFLAIAGASFWAAQRGTHQWLKRMVSLTLHTSGQFAVRFVLLLLAALVSLAIVLGVDFLLGAFVAGMLARAVLQGGDPDEMRVIEAKLDSVMFGFLVPIFFVSTGITFPLAALLGDPRMLILLPLMALLMLVVRGVPGWFVAGKGTRAGDRRTVALFSATTLPLVIAVTAIGTDAKILDETLAAAMVGAAMLTVMMLPMLALVGRSRSTPKAPADDLGAALPEADAGAGSRRAQHQTPSYIPEAHE